MYDRVPTKVAARELVSSPVLINTVRECVYSMQTAEDAPLTPKSHSLTWPCVLTRMFDGLTSGRE